jgi:hypothetical protein
MVAMRGWGRGKGLVVVLVGDEEAGFVGGRW